MQPLLTLSFLAEAKRTFLAIRRKARKIASCANINSKLSLDRIFIRTLRRMRYALGGRKKHFESVVEKLRSSHPFDDSPWVASTFGIYGLADIYPRSIFAQAVSVPFVAVGIATAISRRTNYATCL